MRNVPFKAFEALSIGATFEVYLKQFIIKSFKGEVNLREENKEIGILAERIYRSRKALGITQEMLAEKLGITPQSVSRWENGQSRPDVDMLPRLAAFFGITVDALFGYQAENLKIVQYEAKYKNTFFNWDFVAHKMAREVLGLLPPIGKKNVLEIGCGDGKTAIFFARNGYLVSAFDITESAISDGKKLAADVGVNVNFFCADMLTYNIDTDFDIIYSGGVLQCAPPQDRKHLFEMIQAHTKVGGLNVLNAFVEKSFIDTPSDWQDYEHFFQTAELFGYYGRDWKFEMLQEVYFDSDSSQNPHRHCMDVMIARKISG